MSSVSIRLATSGVALMAAFAIEDAQAQVPTYSWTGFYVGAHAGYGWGDAHTSEGAGKAKLQGPLAGLQAGYNWQLSSLVVGAEVDGSFSGLEGKHDPFFDGKGTNVLRDRQQWVGTARLKVGLPVGGVPLANNVLLYGTGGLAVSRWNTLMHAEGSSFLTGPYNFREKDSRIHLGWVAGAGVEMPLSSSLSLKLEYLRTDYGRKKYDLSTVEIDSFKIDHKTDTVRLGVNYRFSFR